MRLTLVYPDCQEEHLDDFPSKAAAEAAFAEWDFEGIRGRIDSLCGVKVQAWLPRDPSAPPARTWKPKSAPKTKPLRRGRSVRQEAVGAKIMVTAWGETKSLYEWARDPRAQAPWGTIKTRLERKKAWRPEKAISTPPQEIAVRRMNKERAGLEIFGETKTINDWLADSRCEVSPGCLRKRLKKGVPPEIALKAEIPSTYSRRTRQVEAFGETKALSEWAADPRCAVSYAMLLKALDEGAHPEAALSGKTAKRRSYAAFGETKGLAEWLRDPRCAVTRFAVLRRIERGMPFEQAISTPPAAGRPSQPYAAFGETKTFAEWMADPRCVVTAQTVARRLEGGVPFEGAISAERAGRVGGLLTAFGEAKPLEEWKADRRCAVSVATLRSRLHLGMAPEAALTTPRTETMGRRRRGQEIMIFGELRTLEEWYLDPRCEVSIERFKANMAAGVVPELAMRKWVRPPKPLKRIKDLGRRLASLGRRCDQAVAGRDLAGVDQLLVELDRTLAEARTIRASLAKK